MGTIYKTIAATSLLLLLASQLAYSRSIGEDSKWVSDDGIDSRERKLPQPSVLELGFSAVAAETTCVQAYGFLPCSTNVWGLLFLIVVYEILLSIGGQYVGAGSEEFFEIVGPSVVGASLFQLLGTFPQIIIVLVSALSGSRQAAQDRTTLGMGLVAGTTVMLLTLIWGTSVIRGSYDLSAVAAVNNLEGKKKITFRGRGIVTDAETTYTSWIMIMSLVPFVILQLQNAFSSSTGRRVIILIALVVTFVLMVGYIVYQIFQPWVQNRRFEYLMNKYAKDKILQLLSTNGKPDPRKVQQLFNRLDVNKNASVSATELRVLLLGAKIDDADDLTTDRNIESVLESFDISGDGRITHDEFIRGMSQLVHDLSDQSPDRIKKNSTKNPQNAYNTQEGPLSKPAGPSQTTRNPWLSYIKAVFLITFGTFMLCVLAEPLINSVVGLAQAASLPSFCVSYLAIPFALNYGIAHQSIASAGQKTQKSISLTLSAIYGAVYMNNIVGLIVFLMPVYVLELSSDVSAQVVVVLIICIIMILLTSFRTTFPVWVGYLILLLYPISLAVVYVLSMVL